MMLLVSGATKTVMRLSLTHHFERLGVLLTPMNGNSVQSVINLGLPWAVDNSAYSGFNPARFLRLLERITSRGGKPLWVCCPDVVGNAKATFEMFHGRVPKHSGGEPETIHSWRERIKDGFRLPVAYVLQDGQEAFEPPEADAYFIGGTDAWKLSRHSAMCAAWAKGRGKWLHMGRVNSRRRMVAAIDMGCDSVDGGSASRWPDTHMPKLLAWLKQLSEEQTIYEPQ